MSRRIPTQLYVPYYDPGVVYGGWPYPDYPPYYFGYPGYIAGGLIATGLAFGAGWALGNWGSGGNYWGGGFNWNNNNININRPRVRHQPKSGGAITGSTDPNIARACDTITRVWTRDSATIICRNGAQNRTGFSRPRWRAGSQARRR